MTTDDGDLADVHPDEVENYRMGGYQVVESEPKQLGAGKKGKANA